MTGNNLHNSSSVLSDKDFPITASTTIQSLSLSHNLKNICSHTASEKGNCLGMSFGILIHTLWLSDTLIRHNKISFINPFSMLREIETQYLIPLQNCFLRQNSYTVIYFGRMASMCCNDYFITQFSPQDNRYPADSYFIHIHLLPSHPFIIF